MRKGSGPGGASVCPGFGTRGGGSMRGVSSLLAPPSALLGGGWHILGRRRGQIGRPRRASSNSCRIRQATRFLLVLSGASGQTLSAALGGVYRIG